MRKIYGIIISLLLLSMGNVVAQPMGGGMGRPGGPGGGGPFGGRDGFATTIQDPAEMAQKYVDQIKEAMEISPKQEKSLVKLYTNHFNKLQILQSQISDLEKATDQRVTSEILLPEQQQKWNEVKKTLRRGMRNPNRENGGQGANGGNNDRRMGPPPGGGGMPF